MGLVKLGSTRVLKYFPRHGWHSGTVMSFCRPHFLIRYRDGDTEDLLGHQLAKVLHVDATCFTDARAWYYDWSYMHPADVEPWRSACERYCRTHGIDLPSSWLSGNTKPPIVLNEDTSDHESVADFLIAESAKLHDKHKEFLDAARAKRTVANLRNPALKLLWFLASRGHSFPPTPSAAASYFTFIAMKRDCIGAVATSKNALSYLSSTNGYDPRQYESARTTAPLEAMKRLHAAQVEKAAGITPPQVRAILHRYAGPRDNGSRKGRKRFEHWELALGAAICLGYKLLLRYDDLKRCRWEAGYCDVFPTYIRFYLDGRKNNQYGGDFLDVAAPEKPDEMGVYHIVLLAREMFNGKGFVLANISTSGTVDTSRCMSHKLFVHHLRGALIEVGLSERQASVYSAHSLRAGGATAAAVHGLHREDILHLAGVNDPNWLAYYNRTYLTERLRVSRAMGL